MVRSHATSRVRCAKSWPRGFALAKIARGLSKRLGRGKMLAAWSRVLRNRAPSCGAALRSAGNGFARLSCVHCRDQWIVAQRIQAAHGLHKLGPSVLLNCPITGRSIAHRVEEE